MTGRSKFANPRAVECLAYQREIAQMAQYMRVPKFGKNLIGFSRLLFVRFGRPADADNIIKALWDGLQYGGIFDNDNQIRAIDNFRIEYTKDPKEAKIDFEIYILTEKK